MLSFEIGIYKGGYERAWSILDWQIFQLFKAAISVNRYLLSVPPEQRLPRKCFVEQIKFISIKNIL